MSDDGKYGQPTGHTTLENLYARLERLERDIKRMKDTHRAAFDRGLTASVPAPYEGQTLIQGVGLYYYAEDEWRSPGNQFDIKVFSDTQTVAVGDGRFIFAIPEDLDGTNLVTAAAYVTTVSSSGTPTVQIRNITQAADMLTTRITIDASEFTSYTAATAAVVDTANDDVATGNLIAVDVDVAGTGAKGLGVILGFR